MIDTLQMGERQRYAESSPFYARPKQPLPSPSASPQPTPILQRRATDNSDYSIENGTEIVPFVWSEHEDTLIKDFAVCWHKVKDPAVLQIIQGHWGVDDLHTISSDAVRYI